MRYDTVIFDLDGTLTNSHDGITNAVRYALNKMNLPIPGEAGLRKYIGPPLVDSFQRYAGMDAAAAERGALLFRKYYVPTGRFENQRPQRFYLYRRKGRIDRAGAKGRILSACRDDRRPWQ